MLRRVRPPENLPGAVFCRCLLFPAMVTDPRIAPQVLVHGSLFFGAA